MAEKQRSQNSCHDGVVVEWGGSEADARRKKSPSFARMHKAEPYATEETEMAADKRRDRRSSAAHDGPAMV
jgi:hypothetical protein